MATQRMIQFTTDSESSTAITAAIREAFTDLTETQPEGVKLAYWRLANTNQYLALIELTDEAHNPLLGLPATAQLPATIAAHVDGGYPAPQLLESLGVYGFDA